MSNKSFENLCLSKLYIDKAGSLLVTLWRVCGTIVAVQTTIHSVFVVVEVHVTVSCIKILLTQLCFYSKFMSQATMKHAAGLTDAA
jgi:hypothetical protein